MKHIKIYAATYKDLFDLKEIMKQPASEYNAMDAKFTFPDGSTVSLGVVDPPDPKAF